MIPFVKHWHHDAEGNNLCTMLKKSNPSLDSFQMIEGFTTPRKAAIPCKVTSLGEAATTLMDDARIREMFNARCYSERDDIDSMSSGQACGNRGPPMSPEWMGRLELNFDKSEDGTDHEVDGRYDETDGAAEEGPKDYISDSAR